MSLTYWLSVGGTAWYLGVWAVGILGFTSARRRYRERPRSPLSSASPQSVPGVSILRPLKGLETNLYENLESTFKQEYPTYEILFSVADPNDQALSVVHDLIARYPNINAKVIIGEEIVGTNPKVNNLVRSYKKASHDILWVIDSNVMVHPGTLARSVDALISTSPGKPQIALVHHIPYAILKEEGFGSRIEEAFLNTNHAKMYTAINTVAVASCVVGKSNLYRRSDLERVNGSLKPIPAGTTHQEGPTGLPEFGKFLAEDNMIGTAFWEEMGQRHDLSCDVAQNVLGNMSVMDYVWRRVRWIRVRKRMVMSATLAEPLQECIMLSLIGATSFQRLFGVSIWLTLFVHYALWIWVDLDVYCSLAGHPLAAERRGSFFVAWLARELLTLPIWALAMVGDEVEWRGKTYTVLPGGTIEQTEASKNGEYTALPQE